MLARVAAKNMGKRYYCLGADYEWGRSAVEEFRRVFDPLGGEFLGGEYSPVKTDDFLPYLNKVPTGKVDILVGGVKERPIAYKLGKKDAQQIEERSGKSVEEMSHEIVLLLRAGLGEDGRDPGLGAVGGDPQRVPVP